MPQMLGPLDEYPLTSASPADRLAGLLRPQLLRPLLLQRPRPHREHLSDHRYRLLP